MHHLEEEEGQQAEEKRSQQKEVPTFMVLAQMPECNHMGPKTVSRTMFTTKRA